MRPILVIAGTDSSGGAGLTRDAATAAALGFDIKPVVTAVTVQTDASVLAIHPVPADLVTAQIDAAFADVPPLAIKIGMIGSAAIAEAIAARLAARALPIVIDPVLAASSGARLLHADAAWRLFAQADLLTPNLPEAAALTASAPASTDAELVAQARQILQNGCRAVLIKGGHGAGPMATDHLFDARGHLRLSAPRSARNRRGTGCTLATAIACHLARGDSLAAACGGAKHHVRDWIGD